MPLSTPARLRASGTAPYPPTRAIPNGEGGGHQVPIEMPKGPLEVTSLSLYEDGGVREELRQ
eukprot:9128823-Lingulodinium_polyedra.AAC.1